MAKTFTIVMPFTGKAYATIEAESEEAAIQKFLDEASINFQPPKRDTDVEVEEWSFHEQVVEGNYFHGILNKVEVEEQ